MAPPGQPKVMLSNSIRFIFAMSGMEAVKIIIRFLKFNATVKNSKKKNYITSALTYLQHFDQLSVKHFTFFGAEKPQTE